MLWFLDSRIHRCIAALSVEVGELTFIRAIQRSWALFDNSAFLHNHRGSRRSLDCSVVAKATGAIDEAASLSL